MTYPFLQLPDWYFELTTALPEAPKMPENPVENLRIIFEQRGFSTTITKPNIPIFSGEIRTITCIIGLIISIYFYLIPLIIGCLIGIYMGIKEISRIRNAKDYYEREMRAVQESGLTETEYCISRFHSGFRETIRTYYNATLPGWNRETQEYKLKLKNGFSKEELLAFRKNKLADYSFIGFKSNQKTSLNYRKGAMEEHFLNVLRQKFDDVEVLDNCNVGFFLQPYMPDIIIVVDDLIFIDVEIDEPYILDTREPIHYIGADENRTIFF